MKKTHLSFRTTLSIIISYIVLAILLNAFYYIGIKTWVNNDHVKKLDSMGQLIIKAYADDDLIGLNRILSINRMEYYLYEKNSKVLIASNNYDMKYEEHKFEVDWKEVLKYDSPKWFYYETVFSDEIPVTLVLRENAKQIYMEMAILFIIGLIISVVLVIFLYIQSLKRARKEYDIIIDITRQIKSISLENLGVRLGMNGKGELKELIYAFNLMMDNIEQKDKKRKRMLYALSEKMNIPSSLIVGYTKMFAQEGEQNISKRKAIIAIRREAQNISSLLDSFILSIFEDSVLINKIEDFEIGDLIKEIVKETKLFDETHYFDVIIDSNELISGDRDKIKESFRILLSNCMEICPEGHIGLKTSHTERDVVIVIENVESQKGFLSIYDIINKTDGLNSNPIIDKIYLGYITAEAIFKYHGGQILLENKHMKNKVTVILPKKTID